MGLLNPLGLAPIGAGGVFPAGTAGKPLTALPLAGGPANPAQMFGGSSGGSGTVQPATTVPLPGISSGFGGPSSGGIAGAAGNQPHSSSPLSAVQHVASAVNIGNAAGKLLKVGRTLAGGVEDVAPEAAEAAVAL